MVDEEIKTAIIEELEKEYFLVKKHNWLLFLGGFSAVMFATVFSSYQGAQKVVNDTGSKAALEAIKSYKAEAENSKNEVNQFAADIRNGEFKKGMIESLKSDKDFLSKTKGEQGDKGEPGVPGQGISIGPSGQSIRLKNSDGRTVVYIGPSTTGDGILTLYDARGGEYPLPPRQ